MKIRDYIIKNFKNCSFDEIKDSIEDSITENEEVTLPGLGVFFELLWNSSTPELKKQIIENLQNSLN